MLFYQRFKHIFNGISRRFCCRVFPVIWLGYFKQCVWFFFSSHWNMSFMNLGLGNMSVGSIIDMWICDGTVSPRQISIKLSIVLLQIVLQITFNWNFENLTLRCTHLDVLIFVPNLVCVVQFSCSMVHSRTFFFICVDLIVNYE